MIITISLSQFYHHIFYLQKLSLLFNMFLAITFLPDLHYTLRGIFQFQNVQSNHLCILTYYGKCSVLKPFYQSTSSLFTSASGAGITQGKKKKNYLVHLFQISGINLNGIHNIASFGKNYSLLALATSNNHHTAFKHLNETDNFFSYP